MNKRRVWIEELADQYEEWATHPPMRGRDEDYTCCALTNDGYFGFSNDVNESATECLWPIWMDRFGDTAFPAGTITDQFFDGQSAEERDEKRFEFCHYMADRLRELGEEFYP